MKPAVKLKGVGRIYQKTFAGTYCKIAFAKLYATKTPMTATDMFNDMFNDNILPYLEAHQLPMLHLLTDRGIEYCSRRKLKRFHRQKWGLWTNTIRNFI